MRPSKVSEHFPRSSLIPGRIEIDAGTSSPTLMRVMLYEAHHQPEAQHPKSSAIHKLGRPITPSIGAKADKCRIPPNVRYPL
jgi:hypothetical protein